MPSACCWAVPRALTCPRFVSSSSYVMHVSSVVALCLEHVSSSSHVCILLLVSHACILCCCGVPRALTCCHMLLRLRLLPLALLSTNSISTYPPIIPHPSLDPASLPNPHHPSLTLTRKRMDLESQIGRLIWPAYQTRQQHCVLLRRCLLAHPIPASPISRPHTTTHASDTETLRQEPSNTQQQHSSNTLATPCHAAAVPQG